jgi:hypothetical protein
LKSAEPLNWAVMSGNATDAALKKLPIIHAVIGIAPNARL